MRTDIIQLSKWFRISVLPLTMLVLAVGLTACQTAGGGSETTAEAGEAKWTEPVLAPLPVQVGPKKVVAVGKFGAIGAFTAKYGDWDIGDGVAAMLTTALLDSGRFEVVERANISQVLAEQEMKAGGITSSESGPQVGRVTGAQFLIYGSVTEFGAHDKGSGFSIGASGGGLGSLLSTALSRQTTEGSVAMDIRIVDTTSGRIVESRRVQQKISSTGWDVSVGYQGVNLGTNQFYKTPLGEATRKALEQAVHGISLTASKVTWVGRVVEYDGRQLYVNAGTRSAVSVGDKFMIEKQIKRLTDPTTGEVLRVIQEPVGILEITDVDEKIAWGKFISVGALLPERGDLVMPVKR